MTQPVSYLQTDPRWGSLDYSATGEKTTIGRSGCDRRGGIAHVLHHPRMKIIIEMGEYSNG